MSDDFLEVYPHALNNGVVKNVTWVSLRVGALCKEIPLTASSNDLARRYGGVKKGAQKTNGGTHYCNDGPDNLRMQEETHPTQRLFQHACVPKQPPQARRVIFKLNIVQRARLKLLDTWLHDRCVRPQR